MNRRGFLGALAGAIAGATLDPERALWRPGKLISIPKARRNFILLPEFMTGEILLVLQNNLVLARHTNQRFVGYYATAGDRIVVRSPRRFTGVL